MSLTIIQEAPALRAENAIPPSAVTPLQGSAATTVAWRAGNQLYVTIIAKATFSFAPDAPMPRTEPQAIVRAEVHYGNDPGRSIRITSDLAPRLLRADVLFTGPACALQSPARSLTARLGIFASSHLLLEKRLLIQDPAGFTRMPIVYERALRGADGIQNPVGVADASQGPNILDPAQPDRPAGFGPIGRSWPLRKRLLNGLSRRTLEGAIAELPEDFDLSYFQAAPADQRINFLGGDEWIVLEGLHPALPIIRTRLPGARGAARLYGLSKLGLSEGHPLPLFADTLRIDGDEERCTIVCRGSFPIPIEAALSALRAVAGVEIAGEPTVWLEPASDKRAQLATTFALAPGQPSVIEPKAALPFHAASTADAGRMPSPQGWQEPPARPFTGTLDIQPEPDPYGSALPFVAPLSGEARAASAPPSVAQGSVEVAAWRARSAEPSFAPSPASRPMLPADVVFLRPPDGVVVSKTETAASPAPPEPAPSVIPIERAASIAAAIAEARDPAADVLRSHDLTEDAWGAAARHWDDALAEEATRGSDALRIAYDQAYVAAVESFRGAITVEEYVRLVVALERKQSDRALDELKIQRPALMRIIRLWTRKVAADARLFGEVKSIREAMRAAR